MVPTQDALPIVCGLALMSDRTAAIQQSIEITERLLLETGKGLQLGDCDLSDMDLSGFDLRGANLNRARLYGTKLVGCDLRMASLICPGLERTNFSKANLQGSYLHALAAQVCNFSGANLSGIVDAAGSLFHGCNMSKVILSASLLAGASFYQCDLTTADFSHAQMQGAMINECLLEDAIFDNALLAQAVVTKSRMARASLRNIAGEDFTLQRLTGCDGLVLDGANCAGLRCSSINGVSISAEGLSAPWSSWHECHIDGANFSDSDVRGSSWAMCRGDQVLFAGSKLDDGSLVRCVFSGASFERVTAENLKVVESQLRKCSFVEFKARCGTFRDSDLSNSNLSHSYFYRAMITGDPPTGMSLADCRLDSVNFVQAYLAADFSRSNLRGANMTYARLNQSSFAHADLSGVGLYQSSMFKTNFSESRVPGITGAIFVDRCPGLKVAIEKSVSGETRDSLVGYMEKMEALIDGLQSSST